MPSHTPYLASLVFLSACASGDPGPAEDTGPKDIIAPIIVVDSPARGTMTEQGRVEVSGSVSDVGSGVATVAINGQEAEVAPDGSFVASVNLPAGVTLLESVVTDLGGNTSDDVRAILNGTMAEQGTMVKDALVADVNTETLGILDVMVTELAENTDFGQVGQAFNPLVDAGNACAGVELRLDTAEKSGVALELAPTPDGIEVEVVLSDVDADLTASYTIGCFGGGGSAAVNLSANSLTLTGLLDVNINSSGDIVIDLDDLQTSFSGFDLDVGNIHDTIVNLFNSKAERKVRSIIGEEVAKMVPSMGEDFLSDLTRASWTVPLLSDSLRIEIRPVDIQMSNEGIRIRVDASSELANVEGASYLSNPTAAPVGSMAGGQGLSVGLADDIANQLMASLWASGMLEEAIAPALVENMQGVFGETADDVRVNLSLPPMVSTDPTSGAVRLTIGDLLVHVGDASGTLAEFAINAEIDLTVVNQNDSLKLVTDTASIRGKLIEKSPQVVLNLNDEAVAAFAEIAIGEISNQSDGLLDTLPIPSFGAVMVGLPQVTAAEGYLLLGADLQAN